MTTRGHTFFEMLCGFTEQLPCVLLKRCWQGSSQRAPWQNVTAPEPDSDPVALHAVLPLPLRTQPCVCLLYRCALSSDDVILMESIC